MISAGFCGSAMVAEALMSTHTTSSVHTSQTECGYFRLCAFCLSHSLQTAVWGPWIAPAVGLSAAIPPRLQRPGSGKSQQEKQQLQGGRAYASGVDCFSHATTIPSLSNSHIA